MRRLRNWLNPKICAVVDHDWHDRLTPPRVVRDAYRRPIGLVEYTERVCFRCFAVTEFPTHVVRNTDNDRTMLHS